MTKRESGWYFVNIDGEENKELALFSSDANLWKVTGDSFQWYDSDFVYIDPKMAVTPLGEIVYNQPAHDPLYNTKQEG
ncbi:MAG: hypothetical protein ACRDAL_02370 [Plesiomonas shigelloides]